MTRLIALASLTALLTAPAAAQDSDESCQATWDALVDFLIEVNLPVTDPPDEVGVDGSICSATHLTLGDERTALTMARLGWQGLSEETFTELELPEALLLTVDDLRVRNRLSGSPILDWAFDAQQARNLIDLRVEATWDAEAGRLEVAEASADFPGENRIALAFALRGLDFEQLFPGTPPLQDLVFEGLTAEIETNGLFESYALIPAAQVFLDSTSDAAPPEQQLDALQSAWAEQIRAAPDDQLDPGSQEALIEALNALPNPSGLLTLVIAAGDGLGADDLARLDEAEPDTFGALLSLVPQVTIAVTWQESTAEGP